MRWQIRSQGIVVTFVLSLGGLFLGSCRQSGEPTHSSASERLQPASAGAPAATDGTTVYVPVYSSLYLGVGAKARSVDLAATVSVRNTSRRVRSGVRSLISRRLPCPSDDRSWS